LIARSIFALHSLTYFAMSRGKNNLPVLAAQSSRLLAAMPLINH